MNIASTPWLNWPETQLLIQAFEGREFRFVGGAVRDALLGRDVQDVDAATPLTPDTVIALLEKAGIRAIPTGIEHGTVTAVFPERSFEITTLRRDVDCDGRHAAVEFTTRWDEDAARRDFTINALYVDTGGTVHDYVKGLADISPLRLAFIGDADARIREDALRILRFFRFSAQLGVETRDADALAACTRHASLLARLSGERIAREMLKLLASPALSFPLLQEMQRAGVLAHLTLPAPPECLKHLLSLAAPPDPLLRLASWLTGTAPAALVARWKLSNAQSDYLTQMHTVRPFVSYGLSAAAQKKLLRQLGKDRFRDAVLLVWAKNPVHAQAYQVMCELADTWDIPLFPLTGQDLLDMGYAPGKPLGDMLKAMESEWEAGNYTARREDLLSLARQRKRN